MKKIYVLILLISIGVNNDVFSQKKNTSGKLQPYSISNIKLGMSSSAFFVNYPDSIRAAITENSTKYYTYEKLIVNGIVVSNVLVTFYKDKLIDIYFRTVDPKMHWGLSSKYGYKIDKEYQDIYEGEEVTIGVYGNYNDIYGLTYIQFESGYGFIMKDKKASKLSLAEGF